jgi:hypothetical protein
MQFNPTGEICNKKIKEFHRVLRQIYGSITPTKQSRLFMSNASTPPGAMKKGQHVLLAHLSTIRMRQM